jgi:hypothetical protein
LAEASEEDDEADEPELDDDPRRFERLVGGMQLRALAAAALMNLKTFAQLQPLRMGRG